MLPFQLMDATPTTGLSQILTDIGAFFTQAVTWLGDILDTIVNTPALLILVIAMPVIGFSVGLLNRLIRM